MVSPRSEKEADEAMRKKISQQDWVGPVMALWHFGLYSSTRDGKALEHL